MRLRTMEARKELQPGDEIEIVADCPTFEGDLKEFCKQNKKVLVEAKRDGKVTKAKVRY